MNKFQNDAVFSACKTFRYQLSRSWSMEAEQRRCLFVMLNPSTADAQQDDPTIRRCIAFAKSWGYDALMIGNLYAYRATDPARLRDASYPVGPSNDNHLRVMASQANLIVCAWGTKAQPARAAAMIDLLKEYSSLHALLKNTGGTPKHPLYVNGDIWPMLYRPGESHE